MFTKLAWLKKKTTTNECLSHIKMCSFFFFSQIINYEQNNLSASVHTPVWLTPSVLLSAFSFLFFFFPSDETLRQQRTWHYWQLCLHRCRGTTEVRKHRKKSYILITLDHRDWKSCFDNKYCIIGHFVYQLASPPTPCDGNILNIGKTHVAFSFRRSHIDICLISNVILFPFVWRDHWKA